MEINGQIKIVDGTEDTDFVLTCDADGLAEWKAAAGGDVEGTAVLSTGETGASKFLREDGDGTCSWVTGTGAIGIGTTVTSGTEGSVIFLDSSNQLAQDNDKLFWDATNFRLGIGTDAATPSTPLNVSIARDGATITPALKISTTGGYTTGTGTAIDFGIDQDSYPTWVTGRIAAPRTGGSYGGSLDFYTNDNDSATDLEKRMSIDSDGDVKIEERLGVGGVTPSAPIHIEAADHVPFIRFSKSGATKWDVGANVGGLTADEFSIFSQGIPGNAVTILQGGNVGIGVAEPLALIAARVTPPPTAFGSPDLMLGALCDAVGDYSTVGFGWRNADSNRSPAEIGYVCTDSSAGSLGDLTFGTRSVTTSTTAPTERMRIASDGQVSQPVETTTAASSTSVSYTVDFSKSNLQRWVLDASNEDLTLNTPTNMAAGCTVKLYIDFGATPMITSLTLPSWISMGSDISAPSGTAIIISLTSWGTAVGDVTAEALEEF